MSDMIYNFVQLNGTANQINRIKAILAGCDICPDGQLFNPFCFSKLIFVPMYVDNRKMSSDEREKNPNNWYDWRIQHWGVKWPARETKLFIDSETCLLYGFETANTIPRPVINALVGMFCGKITYKYITKISPRVAGKIVYNNHLIETKEEHDIYGRGSLIDVFADVEFGIRLLNYINGEAVYTGFTLEEIGAYLVDQHNNNRSAHTLLLTAIDRLIKETCHDKRRKE